MAAEKKTKIALDLEIGKWLMDIAKYVMTAVIISSFLGNIEKIWLILLLGFVLVGLFFWGGIYFINKNKNR
jgi:hypothetical protein